ncbi:30S ribosomal protein S16 [bacterium]|nr:MAG: 30S ribosomal protein S16 [bacterium]
MSVRIRLLRVGRKKIPCYRVVVMDSRKRRDGAYLEQLGVYHPNETPARVEIKDDRTMYWLSVGASPSDTVRSLLSKAGIMTRFDLSKRGVDSAKIEEEVTKVKETVKARENRRLSTAASKKKQSPVPEKVAADAEADETAADESKSE